MESKTKKVWCDSEVIQIVTVSSYKLNEKVELFKICNIDTNYTFILKSSSFGWKKESGSSLKCITYAMEYINIYNSNITYKESLSKGLWALRITSYVTIYASIWNKWLCNQTTNEKNSSIRMISGNNEK